MPATLTALVNPPLLVWARKESGYAVEPVANRLNVKPERLLAWEQGESKPTVRQAQALAKFYHRPFGTFFLPQPPSLPPLAAEYRRLPGVRPGVESPELRLALRIMSYRREIAVELMEELGLALPTFPVEAHLQETPTEVGKRLRQILGLSSDEQEGWVSEWQALRRWRESVEGVGVLVFQFPKVSLEETRGLSLLHTELPAIGLNSKESSPAARVYTLVHEFVHLALAKGREETVALRETRNATEWEKLERFAEQVSSFILIPPNRLSARLEERDGGHNSWDVRAVKRLAAYFRVTPLAMATRLRSDGVFTWDAYHDWKRAWEAYLGTLKPRKSGGFTTPVGKTLGRAGQPFVKLVLQALDANRITAVDASRQLDLRFDHFEKLRQALRHGPGDSHDSSDLAGGVE